MLSSSFNRQQFSILLKRAMGTRSINQFALHTGVSAAYISKLLRQLVTTSPNPPIIAKLAEKAYNHVTYADFMEAAGYLPMKGLETSYADTVRESSSPYSLDLADCLSHPNVSYKNRPIDKDTRKLVAALLDKIHSLQK